MSETNDKTNSFINFGKVFLEPDGSLYFVKTTETYKFITLNSNGEEVFSKNPTKTETTHVTPESLGYTKKAEWMIYVYKEVKDELEDKKVYYSMLLTFEIPEEKRYKTAYFKKAKSGRVFLMWFDSGCTSEVSINDPEFTKRSKAVRLKEDTILQRTAPVFTLSANGELERRLDSEAVW
jgi:hypothetical protein